MLPECLLNNYEIFNRITYQVSLCENMYVDTDDHTNSAIANIVDGESYIPPQIYHIK